MLVYAINNSGDRIRNDHNFGGRSFHSQKAQSSVLVNKTPTLLQLVRYFR